MLFIFILPPSISCLFLLPFNIDYLFHYLFHRFLDYFLYSYRYFDLLDSFNENGLLLLYCSFLQLLYGIYELRVVQVCPFFEVQDCNNFFDYFFIVILVTVGEGVFKFLVEGGLVGGGGADGAILNAEGFVGCGVVEGYVGFEHEDLLVKRGYHFLLLGDYAVEVESNSCSGICSQLQDFGVEVGLWCFHYLQVIIELIRIIQSAQTFMQKSRFNIRLNFQQQK